MSVLCVWEPKRSKRSTRKIILMLCYDNFIAAAAASCLMEEPTILSVCLTESRAHSYTHTHTHTSRMESSNLDAKRIFSKKNKKNETFETKQQNQIKMRKKSL